MKFSSPKNTLAFQLQGRPLNCQLDFRSMKMSEFSTRAKAFLDKGDNSVRPETEALYFYLGNHALHAVRGANRLHQPLKPDDLEIVETHFKQANDVFMRLFYYTLVICVRETRHLHDKAGLMPHLEKAGVQKSWSLITKVPDDASAAMHSIIEQQHPELTIYELCKGMSLAFHKMHWQSSYGGKAWGIIADALVNLVTGTHSPEIFCDVAFALAHNGGPIFNKGMFYAGYSKELQVILDCQRGGQIPRYVLAKSSKVTADMVKFANKLAKFGADFVGPIDWEQVQKAGPVGDYKHLFVDKATKANQEAAAKVALLKAAETEKTKKFIKGTVQYWNGHYVTAITREGLKEIA